MELARHRRERSIRRACAASSKSVGALFSRVHAGELSQHARRGAGLRPCSPDGLPYVGRFARFANLSAATGHAMMGVSLGPITGKLIAEMLSGRDRRRARSRRSSPIATRRIGCRSPDARSNTHEIVTLERRHPRHHDAVQRRLTVDRRRFLAKHARWLVDARLRRASSRSARSARVGHARRPTRSAAVLEDVRRRGRRSRAGRSRASRRWRTAEAVALAQRREGDRLQRPDGAAAVRLQHRLARDEGARRARSSPRPTCRACSTTTRSRTRPISCRSRSPSSRASFPTCTRSRNRAPTCGA